MPDDPRVLLITGEYPPMEGGVADYSRILAEQMARQGADVHVLTSQAAGGEEVSAGVQRYPWLASWGWRHLYSAVERLVSRLKPAVINVQYQTAAYGMHPAVNLLPWRVRRVPLVATFHDLKVPYLFPKAGVVRWWVNLALARGARAAIATNAEDLERLRACGIHAELIPIGSNIQDVALPGLDRSVWRSLWGLPCDAFVLCYFGFLNESKGGEELILALDNLRRSGYNARLCMLGASVGASDPTNSAYLERVHNLIASLDLGEYVVWTGYLPPEQVSAGFHCADVCVLPYRDGASFRRGSLMAALTHGMPIVTTHPQIPLPELRHGDNVYLAAPRDAAALSLAVASLITDGDLRARLACGARELATQFEWERIAARTLEVYHAVAAH